MAKAVNTRSSEPVPAKGPVDKAMEVMEVLAAAPGPHRLAEVARRTGLSKPTVHRHLRTMAENGFALAEAGGSYQAGPRLLGLAAAALHASPDLRLARPLLTDLRERTGHLAYYAVRDADEVVCLACSEPVRGHRAGVAPGDRLPLRRSAAGLALLSAPPPHEAAGLLDAAGADPGHPGRAVREAARLGYAVDDGLGDPDVRCAAAPVLDAAGRPVGAICVTGLAFTMDRESVEVYGPMARAAARAVSAGLGARPAALGTVNGREA